MGGPASRLCVPLLALLIGGTVASLPARAIERPNWDLRVRISVNGEIELHQRAGASAPVRVPLRWNRFTADGGDPDFATWAELVIALEQAVEAAQAQGTQRWDLVIRFEAAPRAPWAAVDLCYQAAWDGDVGLRNFEFSTRGRNTDIVASRDEKPARPPAYPIAVDLVVLEGREALRVDLRENANNSQFITDRFEDFVVVQLIDSQASVGDASAVLEVFASAAPLGVPENALEHFARTDEFVIHVRPDDDVQPVREGPGWRIPARAMIDLWASLRRAPQCHGAYVLPAGVSTAEWARSPTNDESTEASR